MALPQLSHETLRYGTHSLQTISIATGPNNSPNGLWVVLIHGGAWRDPLQTAASFLAPVASILHSSPFYTTATNTAQQIAAFASISYRLSPHPDHPQDPSITDPCELRDAKHLEHSRDVRTALRLLQSTYGFGERYILVGHSCGATLGFQCVMPEFDSNTTTVSADGSGGGGGGVSAGDDGDGYAHPLAILGTEGIYDLRRLRDTYSHDSVYQEFTEGTFGPDESVWDVVSPAVCGRDGSSGIERGWRAGRLAMLAHSLEDSLVDAGQVALMRDSLVPWEKQGGPGRKVLTLALVGEHDDPWEKGDELARAIAVAIHELQQLLLVGS